MKTVRSSSKSALFLIELIIVIVFFALSSAVCIQLFVKAHLISTASSDLSMASSVAQNAAEAFKNGMAPNGSPLVIQPNTYPMPVWYDGDWNEVDPEEDYAYYLWMLPDQEGEMSTAIIRVYRAEDWTELDVGVDSGSFDPENPDHQGKRMTTLYELTVKRYEG